MRVVILCFMFVILAGCAPAPPTPNLESTVQAAIQATVASLTPDTEMPPASPTIQPSPTAIPSPTLGAGSKQQAEADGMTQVYVPEGTFLMGSPDGDPDVFPHERPQHTVYLDAFWIDQTEVTNAMYARCVAQGACTPPRTGSANTRAAYYGNPTFDAYPVVWVDWAQADAYCRWAGRRLPSEAEWEKAARGTDGQYYPWGDEPLASAMLADFGDISESCARAHYAGCEPLRDTAPVGSRPAGASPYGALDMAGNVWEWVADWYAADYYEGSPQANPAGPEQGTQRVLRGGSFAANFTRDVRSAHRYPMDPDQTIYAFGFRCAASVE